MSDTASHFKNRVINTLEGALRVEHRFAVANFPWSNVLINPLSSTIRVRDGLDGNRRCSLMMQILYTHPHNKYF